MCYILTSFACWCAGKEEAIFDKFQAMERGLTPYPLEITKKKSSLVTCSIFVW